MLPFIRADLAQLSAYIPHTNGGVNDGQEVASISIDRLDTNESPYDLPEDLKQKLAWALQTEIESNRYPDGGHYSLKQAIADYVNESAHLKQGFNADYISVGNGSDELIRSILIATCLGGSGSILVATPTFSMYEILAQTLGIPVVQVGRSRTNFEIDLQAAQQAITQTKSSPVRVVFVVHPNSPTGNALTEAEISWLKSLPDHILVVVDEAYFEFSQTTLVNEIQQRSNWIVLRTFSKAFRLAANRVGYAIATPALTAVLEKVRLPYNLPSLSQVAAQIALMYRQQLLESIPQLLQERDKLVSKLNQHPSLKVWQSQANFIYLTLNTEHSNQSLTSVHQLLRQQGTLVRQIAGGFRITIGASEENHRTLNRFLNALEKFR